MKTVKKVELRTLRSGQDIPAYAVTMATDAGEVMHIFPQDTLHWRAAEYGIDPADTATLLDIVLHEPYIDTSGQHPDFLYNLNDHDKARAAHLAKIEDVRSEVGLADPDNHLQTIDDHHKTTLDAAAHAVRVAQVRRHFKASQDGRATHG